MLHGNIAIEGINITHIVLLLKVSTPRNIRQFKPISLCNVLYKIISKVIVNRMGGLLDCYIHENQGAFIQGRHISNNVLIAYEVLHTLKNRQVRKKGNFALKLDMSKAYDRMEWDFLVGTLLSLGFHRDWMTLVMRCVASVSYT